MIRIITIEDTETRVRITVGEDYTTIGEDGRRSYDRLTIAGISPHLNKVSLRDSKGRAILVEMNTLLRNIAEGIYQCVAASI